MRSTVLVATDGSDPARRAESFARSLLDPNRHHVLLVSVAHAGDVLEGYPDGGDVLPVEDPGQLEDKLLRRAREAVGGARSDFEEEGFEVTVRTPGGRPGPSLCELAGAESVEFIVMSRRGRGAVGELILGSVSRYVIHHAPCPVMVVPPDGD